MDWGLLAPSDRQAFECAVMDNLDEVAVADEVLHCSGCSSIDHHNVITASYEQIIACIRKASDATQPYYQMDT